VIGESPAASISEVLATRDATLYPREDLGKYLKACNPVFRIRLSPLCPKGSRVRFDHGSQVGYRTHKSSIMTTKVRWADRKERAPKIPEER